MLLETLALVAAEVFGRTLPVMHQALLLAAVLLTMAVVNNTCSPNRLRVLALLEFVALGVLGLTVTLGLAGKAAEEPYAAATGAESVSVSFRAWQMDALLPTATRCGGSTRAYLWTVDGQGPSTMSCFAPT